MANPITNLTGDVILGANSTFECQPNSVVDFTRTQLRLPQSLLRGPRGFPGPPGVSGAVIANLLNAGQSFDLPADPVLGTELLFAPNQNADWGTGAAIINHNNQLIEGANENLLLDFNFVARLCFIGGTQGWILSN